MNKNRLFCFFIFLSLSLQAQTFKDTRKTMSDSVFKAGDVVKIPPILFSLDKAGFLETDWYSAHDTLLKICHFLVMHPNLRVEVSGHTDTRSSPEYSSDLSYNRAKAVSNALGKMGISPFRLLPKGYAGMKPLIPAAEIQKMKTKEEQEKAHQVNRRIELKILSTDFAIRRTMNDTVFENGDIVECPVLLFDLDGPNQLLPSEKNDSADKMVRFLNDHPAFIVEVASYTDYRGGDKYNLLISQARADHVKDYLIRNGIDSSRIKAKGYGETKPLMLQETIILPSGNYVFGGQELTESFIERQTDKKDIEALILLARRIELTIISGAGPK